MQATHHSVIQTININNNHFYATILIGIHASTGVDIKVSVGHHSQYEIHLVSLLCLYFSNIVGQHMHKNVAYCQGSLII